MLLLDTNHLFSLFAISFFALIKYEISSSIIRKREKKNVKEG